MSKNDNVIRVWTNPKESEPVGHWYWREGTTDEGYWLYFAKDAYIGSQLSYDSVFCLNDADHTPCRAHVETDSLGGRV